MEGFTDYSRSDGQEIFFINNINMDPTAKNYSNCDVLGSFYEVVENVKKDLTAFGYEQDNGTVSYVLVGSISIDEIVKKEYLKTRTVPSGTFEKLSCPLEEYTDNRFLLKADTDIHILYRLNGIVDIKGRDGKRLL